MHADNFDGVMQSRYCLESLLFHNVLFIYFIQICDQFLKGQMELEVSISQKFWLCEMSTICLPENSELKYDLSATANR